MEHKVRLIRKQKRGKQSSPVWREVSLVSGEFPYLSYPLLEQTGMVKHCFTTRLGGVSEGIFESLNLSFSRGDQRSAVEENFQRVSQALGTEYGNFVFTDQTHTVNVRRVGIEDAGKGLTRDRGYSDVDGLITNEPGLVLSTFYADCVPLYFVDTKQRAIGLSHSGWRGTIKRMGKVTLETMCREFGTLPEDVICAIGPSICQDCYEVSEDVAEEFNREFSSHSGEILENKGNGKYQLDLWRANEIILLEAGIKPEHLSVTDLCTCCNDKILFSHRASQGKRGNLGAFLCLKPEI
ncbi:MAG: peptidoglycan editing factor PgeF [Lachnospiraceae bacterium]|nr:peptidoglycan editing factor PgeF [Lachnospiraceae bacterium]